MSWRDNLFDASFRGAAFKVSLSNFSGGRRTEVHQYINRDKPFIEDLGADTDDFQIEAYIIQNPGNEFDYIPERDSLINALQSEGPGTLVHPFYGIKRVSVVGKFSVNETFDAGGIARFSISFSETGDRVVPESLLNFIDKVDNAVNQAFDVVGDFFSIAYETSAAFDGLISNAVTKATNTVKSGLNGIQNIPTSFINSLTKNVNLIKQTANTLTDSPNDIYNGIKDSANNFAIAAGMGEKVKNEFKATEGTPGNDDLIVNDRSTDIYADALTIESEVIGGETGNYSGISRGENVRLNGESVPNSIGKSVLISISNEIANFTTNEFGLTPVSQQKNIIFIFNIMKMSFLATATRIAIRTDFFSQQEAVMFKDIIMDDFETFLTELANVAANGSGAINIGNGTAAINNKEIYDNTEFLRNTFSEAMDERIFEEPRTYTYDPSYVGENALTLAYNLYDDVSRYSEIYRTNRETIQHPGFLNPGTEIEVLEK